jgi:D-alanyl-D-alanine carboxypeptidase
MPDLHLASLVALLCVSLAALGCDGTDEEADHDDDVQLDARGLAELEQLADEAVAAGIPGVSVAIIRDGKHSTITRGVSDRDTGAGVSPEHRFRMGSIAKSFTAAMILQLAERGQLTLDDTLEEWLPGVLPASSDVTIELLLRQESGIFDFANDERHMAPYIQGDMDFHWEPRELAALSAEHAPVFEAGTQWAYSNTNFLLLGMIVERATGESLELAVRKHIASPLGLGETTMEVDSDMTAPFMRGYLVGQGDPLDVTRISGSAVFGHGNLISTPRDVARFYERLMAGSVVGPEALSAMLSLDPRVPSHYAMGLFRFDEFFSCGTFVGHDGQTPGYDSAGYTSLDGRRQVVVSVSSSTFDDKAGNEAAHRAFGDLVKAAACR